MPRQGKALPDYLAQAAVCTVAMAVSLLIFH